MKYCTYALPKTYFIRIGWQGTTLVLRDIAFVWVYQITFLTWFFFQSHSLNDLVKSKHNKAYIKIYKINWKVYIYLQLKNSEDLMVRASLEMHECHRWGKSMKNNFLYLLSQNRTIFVEFCNCQSAYNVTATGRLGVILSMKILWITCIANSGCTSIKMGGGANGDKRKFWAGQISEKMCMKHAKIWHFCHHYAEIFKFGLILTIVIILERKTGGQRTPWTPVVLLLVANFTKIKCTQTFAVLQSLLGKG